MANTFRNDTFRPLKTLSNVTMGFLGSVLLCAFLYLILSFALILFPDAQMDLGDGTSMAIAFGLIGIVALFEIVLRICTIVFFLIWEHRAFSNLSALKAQNLEHSPGWAVGWWFIPFANLVKPFLVMRELWNESDPDFDEELGFLSNSTGTPLILGFWWATFLLGNITYRISDRLIDNDGNISEAFPILFMVAAIFNIVAASLAILTVKNITQRQEERSAKIGQSQQFRPPPPPSFNPQIENKP